MFSITISFLIGNVITNTLTQLPSILPLAIMLLVCTVIAVKIPTRCSYLIISLLLGITWTTIIANSQLEKRLAPELEAVPLQVTGTISSIPGCGQRSCKFRFSTQRHGNLLLRWYGIGKNLQVGDEWQFTVRLKREHYNANPGSFDTETYFFREGIAASGYIDLRKPRVLLASSKWSQPINRLRQLLQNKITLALQGKLLAGLIIALVIGEKSAITPELWQVLQDTGTAHLMAISGLHVGLVAGFGFWIFKMLWRALPRRYLLRITVLHMGAIGAIVFALSYALLAGFAVATQRACIMVLMFMASILWRRLISAQQSYFIALLLVLIVDPLATLSAGFWLSFAAVGVILYGATGRLQITNKWWHSLGKMQWLIFVGLLPLSLAIFNKTSLVAPIANAVAIPWVSFLVVPAALLGALGPDCILQFSIIMLDIIWIFLELLNGIALPAWQQYIPNVWVFLCAVFGVIWILAPRGIPCRYLGLLCFLPIFLASSVVLEEGEARFTLLDVGQGLAAVIATKNHILVYDAGPRDGIVLPFLVASGHKQVDKLVLSHPDQDHIGGAYTISKKFPELEIMISDPNAWRQKYPESKVVPQSCRAGQRWRWDGVDFIMLHPVNIISKKRNEHSCVLKIVAGDKSVLLTGDIGIKSEQELLLRVGKQLTSDILVVPHHGSKTSSLTKFIRQVNPLYALIPVGYRNRYGHPKKDIVMRYAAENIKLFNSVRDGAISFILSSKQKLAAPECYRIENLRYWHATSL
ncbi:MAG: DNA internalization-related competence protein ComEC/Rec2 [Thiotrichales bacterium]|nr:MAG: DNA internalization-related competence protein ComEC/Rec2 [Thiotrichales bacterium]